MARRRETIASNVLSFPEFGDPKWPKKLTFRDLCEGDRAWTRPPGLNVRPFSI